jgi:hypothetical protein
MKTRRNYFLKFAGNSCMKTDYKIFPTIIPFFYFPINNKSRTANGRRFDRMDPNRPKDLIVVMLTRYSLSYDFILNVYFFHIFHFLNEHFNT